MFYPNLMGERYRVRSPLFPIYRKIQAVINVWNGLSKTDVYQMIQDIFDITGTPQATMDWTDPDRWIDERLSGTTRDIAKKTWENTNKLVNPRHCYGAHLFINKYKLLEERPDGRYGITEFGDAFLKNNKEIIAEIDEMEGLPQYYPL